MAEMKAPFCPDMFSICTSPQNHLGFLALSGTLNMEQVDTRNAESEVIAMRKISDMLYHEGIVLKIYPSFQQQKIVAVNDGVRRFVYNKLVERDKSYFMQKAMPFVPAYQNHLAYLDWSLKCAENMRTAFPFLNEPEVDSCVLATTKSNFFAAISSMIERHTGRPKFAKKSAEQSYQTSCVNSDTENPSVRILDQHHIKLPKLGAVRFDGSPDRVAAIMHDLDTYNARIGTVTVRKDGVGEYWVSLSFGSDEPIKNPLPETGSAVGIDVNLSNCCAISDGTVVENPKCKKQLDEAIRKAQRKLSKKKIFADRHGLDYHSKNYDEQRIKLAYLHRKVERQREEFEHCLSKSLVESQDWIFAEGIRVKNLMANHHLAGAIADASWSEFTHMLDYKAAMYGKHFEKVSAVNTTQQCCACGHICKDEDHIDLGVEVWTCPECGTVHSRDLNAACNILMKGIEKHHLSYRIPVW